jgi:hypothetical protein
MKICVINIMPQNSEMHRNALIESCRKVASSNTEIVYKDTKAGTVYLPALRFGYTRLLNGREIIESMLEAQREGCDAIFYD